MKKVLSAFVLVIVAAVPFQGRAAEFVDRDAPASLLNLGVRLGITSSNVSTDIPGVGDNSEFSWKRGFNAGAVVDLNFRNYFSIQPGFFFENRSYNYLLVEHDPSQNLLKNELGHTRSYSFTVPVLAAFHFNLSDKFRWSVEAGPYFQFGIGDGKDEVEQISVSAPEGASGSYVHTSGKRDYYGDGNWQHRSFDWGLKIGTGLRFLDHYVFNIHYQRGFRNVSANHNNNWEMHNKCWTFTLGYDF